MNKRSRPNKELLERMHRCESALSGGYLKEIPFPHYRRYDVLKIKRSVSVRVGQFIGFHHYFASLREDDNPIFHPNGSWDKTDTWHLCWDDEEGKGKYISSEAFDSYRQVQDWVRQELQKNFPKERYTYHETGVKSRWLYREGD